MPFSSNSLTKRHENTKFPNLACGLVFTNIFRKIGSELMTSRPRFQKMTSFCDDIIGGVNFVHRFVF